MTASSHWLRFATFSRSSNSQSRFNVQFSLLFLSFLTFGSAFPVEPREEQSLAPQLLTTINDLNTAVTDVTTAVKRFDGSLLGLLPQALPVVKTEARVDFTIPKATRITEKGASLTAEESTNIVDLLASGIDPLQTTLEALKAKVCSIATLRGVNGLHLQYAIFEKTLTAPIVLLDLEILKKHTEELIDTLTVKATADNVGLLGLEKGSQNQSFNDAIAVYSA